MSEEGIDSSVARERFDILAEAASLTRSGLPAVDVADRLIALCRRILPVDAIAIWRLNSRAAIWSIFASHGLSEEYRNATVPVRDGDFARLLREPFVVDDVAQWGEISGRSELYGGEAIKRILVLPLTIRGELAGTISCYFRTVHPLTEQDLAAARALASVASNALSVSKLDRLADVARVVSAELDTDKVVQYITDAATELTGAQFGAFFYNVVNASGESYMLYAISGVPREAFSKFPMPRNTQIFSPTFTGEGIVRSANIQKDPRYGHNAPYFGMPAGHLPVVSYLAVPVITRDGEVLGGLFFGHEKEGVFSDAEERIAEALAAQAAVTLDNARLYRALREDRARSAASERRYRSLVLTTPTPQAITIATPAGLRENDSDSWRELTGQTYEDSRGRGWLNAVADEDHERVAEAWDHAIASQTTFDEQYRLRMKDGSNRWFASRAVPVLDTEGKVEEWVGTNTDIHDVRVNEDSARFLAKATELFAASLDYEETLKTLTSLAVPRVADWCAVDIVDGTDAPFRRIAIAHVDPAKTELAWEMFRRYPPDPKTSAIAAVLRTGVAQLVTTIPEGLIESMVKDEEQLRIAREVGLMSWMIVPLRSRGRVLGAVSFISSDSRRRFTSVDMQQAEELARRASVAMDNAMLYGDAQAANRAKDEFLATLSHELRTPMTSILGWAKLLRMGLSPEESRDAVEAIEKSAQVQAQLIDDILDVSRIISGKLRVDVEPVDLRAIAQAALATVHPAAQAKNIEILTSFPPTLPAVAGDEGRLQQVVWNLLANAIKFTSRGGTVTIRVNVDGSLVRLMVQDTGEGIAPEFLSHVFEAFRQADSSTTRVHGGIGLGLAIVRYIVELHGGRVSVASAGSGKGSTFTVELPVLESAISMAPVRSAVAERNALSADTPLPSLSGMHILTIDAQAYTRDVVSAILRRCGAEVTTAESVRQALAMIKTSAPDVVICDIAMPEEDGYAFIRQLRDNGDQTSSLPVVALTAFGRPEDRQTALTAGFDDYVKKPAEPADLANAVLGVVGRKSRR